MFLQCNPVPQQVPLMKIKKCTSVVFVSSSLSAGTLIKACHADSCTKQLSNMNDSCLGGAAFTCGHFRRVGELSVLHAAHN